MVMMRNSFLIGLSLAGFSSSLLLSSCTFFRLARSAKLKQPTFRYVDYRFKQFNDVQSEFEFTVSSYNPNTIGLKNVTVSYELFTQDKRFLKGGNIPIDLKPQDTARLVIPAAVIYRDVFNAVGPSAAALLRDRSRLPVRIDAVISGNPTLYNEIEEGGLFAFTLEISRTVDVPLEGLKSQAGKSARRLLKKVF
jgi:hypothetical protein